MIPSGAKGALSRATVPGGRFISSLTDDGQIEIRKFNDTDSGPEPTDEVIRWDPADSGRIKKLLKTTLEKAKKLGIGVTRSRHALRAFSIQDAIAEAAADSPLLEKGD